MLLYFCGSIAVVAVSIIVVIVVIFDVVVSRIPDRGDVIASRITEKIRVASQITDEKAKKI